MYRLYFFLVFVFFFSPASADTYNCQNFSSPMEHCVDRAASYGPSAFVLEASGSNSANLYYQCGYIKDGDERLSITYSCAHACTGDQVPDLETGVCGDPPPDCDGDGIPDSDDSDSQCSSCQDGESYMTSGNNSACCPSGSIPTNTPGFSNYGSTNSCGCPDMPLDQQTGVCSDNDIVPPDDGACDNELQTCLSTCGSSSQVETFECSNDGSTVSSACVCGTPDSNGDACPDGTVYGSFNGSYGCFDNGDGGNDAPDMDGDGIPDSEDGDIDGDGIPNSSDDTPSGPGSGTGDGTGDGGGDGSSSGDGEGTDVSGIESRLDTANDRLTGIADTAAGINTSLGGIGGKIDETNSLLTAGNAKADNALTKYDLTNESLNAIKEGITSQNTKADDALTKYDLTNESLNAIKEGITSQNLKSDDALTKYDLTNESLGNIVEGISSLNDKAIEGEGDTELLIENQDENTDRTTEVLQEISDKIGQPEDVPTNEQLSNISDSLVDLNDKSESAQATSVGNAASNAATAANTESIAEGTAELVSNSDTANDLLEDVRSAVNDLNGTTNCIDDGTGFDVATNVDMFTCMDNENGSGLDKVGKAAAGAGGKVAAKIDELIESQKGGGIGSNEEDAGEVISGAKARLNAAYDRMSAAPIIAAGGDVFGSLPSGAGNCPVVSFGIFQQTISTSLHCEIYDSISSEISAVMLAFWSIVAVMVFRRA